MRPVVCEQTELSISRISNLGMNQMNQASCSWTNIYTNLISSASEHSHGKTPVLVHWTSIVHQYWPVRSDIWRMGKAANKLDICSWFILQSWANIMSIGADTNSVWFLASHQWTLTIVALHLDGPQIMKALWHVISAAKAATHAQTHASVAYERGV